MKLFSITLLLTFIVSASSAADTLEALTKDIEAGVQTCSKADFRNGFRHFARLSLKQKTPQELLGEYEENKETFSVISSYGETDTLSKISLVRFGERLGRVRFLDQKAKGDVLWTFGCYKSKDQWYLVSIDLAASAEPGDSLKKLDPADAVLNSPEKISSAEH